MGANPMQKMKRNSMLSGLTIGLLIGLILCVFVYMFLSNPANSVKKEDAVTVSVLAANVKSGQTVSVANVIPKVINVADKPADAITLPANVVAVAKIDLSAGTILTQGMLNSSQTTLTNDLRQQEYNMIALPQNVSKGKFIDIRLQLPTGGDYIVVSKKEVLDCNATTIWLNMYEEEIELMSNAIIEYYIMAGSKLYATLYTDPGLQTAAVGTYVPNDTVSSLISNNPNVKNYINSERYSQSLKDIRNNYINAAVNSYSDNAIDNIETNIKKEIESLKKSRETYFAGIPAVN